MNYPKISIVTASFNQVNYIEYTIKSIIDQNYPNLEYIIIDGGSTDGSIEIIRKYEKYITYWVSEKDMGVCDAINKGFRISTGEIMGCINSDDMLHPNSLFSIANIFMNNSLNWILGASTVYDELGKTVYIKQSKNLTIYDYLLGEYEWIQLESTFWTKKLWDDAGGYFNFEYKYAGDFDLWARFFKISSLVVTNALIGGFRLRQKGQLSTDNSLAYLNEVKEILNFHASDVHTIKKMKLIKFLVHIVYVLRKTKIFAFESIIVIFDKKINKLKGEQKRLEYNFKELNFYL